jgi:acetolactate synthase-1/2/3 large subunit
VGAHTHQIASQWTVHGARQFLITNGWSSMGFGLPAAIAAKIAAPEKPVACLIGDGCFQMTCGELAVAKRLRLALPVVVLNDCALSLIKVKQSRREFPIYGTELDSSGWDEPPSHYFGVRAIGVHDGEGLRAAFRESLTVPEPTVIEAAVDAGHYIQTVYD